MLKIGDLVTVVDYKGQKLTRKAVEISLDTVYVCTEQEFQAAKAEGKEPICVGFLVQYVEPCHGKDSLSVVPSE